MEYSSDVEFYGTYKEIAEALKKDGWQENKEYKPIYAGHNKISVLFTKNGFGLYLLYGCEKDVKDEIL